MFVMFENNWNIGMERMFLELVLIMLIFRVMCIFVFVYNFIDLV